jgi:nucleoid-associated protein YgaU
LDPDAMRGRLAAEQIEKLRERERELLQAYTDDSAPIQSIRKQIANIESNVTQRRQDGSQLFPANYVVTLASGPEDDGVSPQKAETLVVKAKLNATLTHYEFLLVQQLKARTEIELATSEEERKEAEKKFEAMTKLVRNTEEEIGKFAQQYSNQVVRRDGEVGNAKITLEEAEEASVRLEQLSFLEKEMNDPRRGNDLRRFRLAEIHQQLLRDYLSEEPYTSRGSDGYRTYIVMRGDNLQTISRKVYGRRDMWRKIYDANRPQMRDDMNLTLGQKLTIPDL